MKVKHYHDSGLIRALSVNADATVQFRVPSDAKELLNHVAAVRGGDLSLLMRLAVSKLLQEHYRGIADEIVVGGESYSLCYREDEYKPLLLKSWEDYYSVHAVCVHLKVPGEPGVRWEVKEFPALDTVPGVTRETWDWNEVTKDYREVLRVEETNSECGMTLSQWLADDGRVARVLDACRSRGEVYGVSLLFEKDRMPEDSDLTLPASLLPYPDQCGTWLFLEGAFYSWSNDAGAIGVLRDRVLRARARAEEDVRQFDGGLPEIVGAWEDMNRDLWLARHRGERAVAALQRVLKRTRHWECRIDHSRLGYKAREAVLKALEGL